MNASTTLLSWLFTRPQSPSLPACLHTTSSFQIPKSTVLWTGQSAHTAPLPCRWVLTPSTTSASQPLLHAPPPCQDFLVMKIPKAITTASPPLLHLPLLNRDFRLPKISRSRALWLTGLPFTRLRGRVRSLGSAHTMSSHLRPTTT